MLSLVARRYSNPWPGSTVAGLGSVLKWMGQRARTRRPADPPRSSFPLSSPAFHSPRASDGILTVTWVGHASTLLQLGPLNVLTDPMWGERASPVRFAGPRRWVRPGIAFDDLPPLDLVVLSHDHYDHFDRRTLRRIVRRHTEARWVAPVGVGRQLRRLGATAVSEHGWWDRETADDLGLTVACTPAKHFSGRTPWGRNRTLWSGWVLKAGGRSVFFAGDTAWHPEFPQITRRFGPFDLVLLPVGAYEPAWIMSAVHMDPDSAVRAYREIADTQVSMGHPAPPMLPIHWGTFKLSDEPMDEPPARLRAAWQSAQLPDDRLWLLRHGETRTAPATVSS